MGKDLRTGLISFSRSSAPSAPAEIFLRSCAAERPRAGFIRMSSGPGNFVEKPLRGASSCIEETPRSARMQSAKPTPHEANAPERPAKLDFLTSRTSVPNPSARSRLSARGNSSGSTSSPRRCPPGRILPRMASACPPWPSVQSTTVSPACGLKAARTSATMTGTCDPAGVFPEANTFATVPGYFSGASSLYFSSNLRGFFPGYRGLRRWGSIKARWPGSTGQRGGSDIARFYVPAGGSGQRGPDWGGGRP